MESSEKQYNPYAAMKECDLIMKGGVTSGVVFPKALVALSKKYRFRSIGGTSAGSIAAVVAAAAEYRRQKDGNEDGFDKIDALPNLLGSQMSSLFQPSKEMAPLYEVATAALKGRDNLIGYFRKMLAPTKLQVALAASPGIAIVILAALCAGDWLGTVFGILLGVLVAALGVLLIILKPTVKKAGELFDVVMHKLPKEDFGVCPGIQQDGNPNIAFTDWIHFHIQDVAGRTTGDTPLTLGELQEQKIEIAAVTTDLSSQRPYQLPIKSNIYYFSEAEFRELFPPKVVDYLVCEKRRLKDGHGPNNKKDLYALPPWEEWPLLLVARMSLSFPFLIRAVPLYRYDLTLEDAENRVKHAVQRCIFSDGGITSNFPIHFFDSWLPSRPTFGISLSEYDPQHRPFSRRIHWRRKADDKKALQVRRIDSLQDFAGAMFDSARNWQEMLQSQLHGYDDRIVEVRLKPSEGGLNLDMDPKVIHRIAKLGETAGRRIVKDFDFEEHRWRRAVTLLYRASEQLITLSDREDKLKYGDMINNIKTKSFEDIWKPEGERKKYADLLNKMADIGKQIRKQIVKDGEASQEYLNTLNSPSQELTQLRITPSIDTYQSPQPPPNVAEG